MNDMFELLQPSFDAFVASLLICLTIRESLLYALPDHIAGPGGWLIDTGDDI